MTLTLESDLDSVKMKRHAKHLRGQRSFRSKVIVRTPPPLSHTHTQRTDRCTWTTKVIGNHSRQNRNNLKSFWNHVLESTLQYMESEIIVSVISRMLNVYGRPAYVADADIIFLPCGFLWSPYGIGQTVIFFALSFVLFSSPNLSRRRLDVCHTSTHGVALVRI